MTIKDLKELTKLAQLCRKIGIATIEVDGIKITMGADPKQGKTKSNFLDDAFPEANIKVPTYTPVKTGAIENNDDIKTDMPTEEQLLNWSVRDEGAGAN